MLLVPAVLKELKEEQRVERILYSKGTIIKTLPLITTTNLSIKLSPLSGQQHVFILWLTNIIRWKPPQCH